MYYFAPGQLAPAAGEYVIVETARGEECGEVVKPVHEVPDSKISKPLRPALRMADAIDLRRMEKTVQTKSARLRCVQSALKNTSWK